MQSTNCINILIKSSIGTVTNVVTLPLIFSNQSVPQLLDNKVAGATGGVNDQSQAGISGGLYIAKK
jgi:hypothetical protein